MYYYNVTNFLSSHDEGLRVYVLWIHGVQCLSLELPLAPRRERTVLMRLRGRTRELHKKRFSHFSVTS
jgi:hypothetical protein